MMKLLIKVWGKAKLNEININCALIKAFLLTGEQLYRNEKKFIVALNEKNICNTL